MKYLKDYKLFLEEDEFEITDTDQPDVKVAKGELNNVQSQLAYYKQNKTKIDELYKKDALLPQSNPEVLQTELNKIIGIKEKINPFLAEYSSVVGYKYRLNKLQDKDNQKAIEMSDFRKRLGLATTPDSITSLTAKINDIQIEQGKIKKELQDNMGKLPELEKQHNETIKKTEEDLKNWIEKIQ